MPSPPAERPELRRLGRIADAARAADGQPPFSDQAMVEVRTGTRRLLFIDDVAAAILGDGEAQFVVTPDARGRGHGTAMLETLLGRYPRGMRVWAHGDHPAARSLAASHGLRAARRLLHLRAAVSALDESPVRQRSTQTSAQTVDEYGERRAGTVAIGHFRTGEDDAAWLALNARAFASHPEQGAVTQRDLDELAREPWFRQDDFLVARDGAALVGYCWLKVDGGLGEFYVVGVDPDRQGSGLGRRLMAAGFARLAERGIPIAHLYVEADNLAAVALYRSMGFTDHEVDVQYEWLPN